MLRLVLEDHFLKQRKENPEFFVVFVFFNQ